MPREVVLKIISELKVNIDDIKVRFKNIENVTVTKLQPPIRIKQLIALLLIINMRRTKILMTP